MSTSSGLHSLGPPGALQQVSQEMVAWSTSQGGQPSSPMGSHPSPTRVASQLVMHVARACGARRETTALHRSSVSKRRVAVVMGCS